MKVPGYSAQAEKHTICIFPPSVISHGILCVVFKKWLLRYIPLLIYTIYYIVVCKDTMKYY